MPKCAVVRRDLVISCQYMGGQSSVHKQREELVQLEKPLQ